jgi:hypothetical protein
MWASYLPPRAEKFLLSSIHVAHGNIAVRGLSAAASSLAGMRFLGTVLFTRAMGRMHLFVSSRGA